MDTGTDVVTSYLTTFAENGLPLNTRWSVDVNGLVVNSTSDLIVFSTMNGTFSYSIPDVTVYVPHPASIFEGNVSHDRTCRVHELHRI